jgi:hypothetical protein
MNLIIMKDLAIVIAIAASGMTLSTAWRWFTSKESATRKKQSYEDWLDDQW